MSDIELFDGLVSPEVANVLDEAMRAMPDSAVSMAPSEPGSDVVNVAIGGGAYDLLVAIDGADCVSELKLVPVHGMGCAGNAVDVLKAGLGVLSAAEGTKGAGSDPCPNIDSLFGAFRGATGGMSSVDFVRAIRDEE